MQHDAAIIKAWEEEAKKLLIANAAFRNLKSDTTNIRRHCQRCTRALIKANVVEPIPVTTRWSDEVDVCTEIRSPFVSTGIPKDELFMVTKLRDEAVDLQKKEDDERDRLVLTGMRSTVWR
jgi:hypothetical protein